MMVQLPEEPQVMGALQCPAGTATHTWQQQDPWESWISSGEGGNQLLGPFCTPSTSSMSEQSQPAASPTPARSLGLPPILPG